VRGAAVWALAQLDRSALDRNRARHLAAESDPEVRGEWDSAATVSAS